MATEQVCQLCGAPIVGRTRRAKWCSEVCIRASRKPYFARYNRRTEVREREADRRKTVAYRSYQDAYRRSARGKASETLSQARKAERRKWLIAADAVESVLHKGYYAAEYELWTKYRLTPEDWARLYEAQHGRCAGCDRTLKFDKSTHTDHCHKTGIVRGLLCRQCNHALGKVSDSPLTLRRLAEYLEVSR